MSFTHPEVSAKLAAPYRHASTSVVVLLTHDGRSTAALFGDPGVPQPCAPQDVLFEIGSITKVFTALLLARLVVDGEIEPDRPIGEICPAFAGVPAWVTPSSLASHTSGLPRLHVPLWTLLVKGVPDDPYADFTRDQLIAWMRAWRPARPPRTTSPRYSNLGFGLLGEVLAMSQGAEYDALLRDKVLNPLGLTATSIALTSDQQRRFSTPHAASGRPVMPWTFRAMAGAGALRSTAGDLARLADHVVAALEHPATRLHRAIALTASPVAGFGRKGLATPMAQCLGWISMTLGAADHRMLFHDGGTAGSTSALYVCPRQRAAIIVLANRGVAASMWSSLRLARANPHRVAHDYFAALPP
ncbi:MAG: serine hydrolase domain-containing protein [Hyphomicrobiaceae bacterium]|nr:serine hydrolase domain-containing protein [Hyphomicrobiaceae bacterium]